jgi:dienelactone hydrolase
VDSRRIGVVGLSMGGEEAIGAAAADPRIRAVVAEGASQRTAADKQWLSDVYGVAGALQEQLDRVTYSVTDLLTPADPPTALRRAAELAAPVPMLLIAGGAVPDEQNAAQWIQAGSPDTVSVWVVPGAGPIAGLRTDPEQWTDQVTDFLDEALGTSRS